MNAPGIHSNLRAQAMRKLALPLLIAGLFLGLGASAPVPPKYDPRDVDLATAQQDFTLATTNWGDGVAPEKQPEAQHAIGGGECDRVQRPKPHVDEG